MDLPIEIFLSFIGFSIVMGIVGLWKKVPFLMFIAGGVITFWAFTTDNIILNDRIDTIDTINSNGTEIVRDYLYNVDVFTGTEALSTTVHARAELATASSILVGKSFNCIEVFIGRTAGLPSTDLNVGIMVSNGTMTTTIGIIAPSSVTVNLDWHEVCLPASTFYVVSSGNYIGYKNVNSNTTNAYIGAMHSGSVFDGTNTYRQSLSNLNVWSGVTSNDLTIRMYNYTTNIIPTETTSYTYTDNTIEFTAYPKILFGLIASIFMIAGALIWKMDDS
jgi:hypothetical protein